MPDRFGSNESTYDALRATTLGANVTPVGNGDATYLRLDASNDPVTGALDVKVSNTNALRVLDGSNNEIARVDTVTPGFVISDGAGHGIKSSLVSATNGRYLTYRPLELDTYTALQFKPNGNPSGARSSFEFKLDDSDTNFRRLLFVGNATAQYIASDKGGTLTGLPLIFRVGNGDWSTLTDLLKLTATGIIANASLSVGKGSAASYEIEAAGTDAKILVTGSTAAALRIQETSGTTTWYEWQTYNDALRLNSSAATDLIGVDKATGATTFKGQVISSLANGTSPFSVTSTTLNTNLNADLLDGNHASAFEPAQAKGNLTASSPLSFDNTRQVIGGAAALSIANAKADATTKGAATFKAADFEDDGSGLISLDYANGQAASHSAKGFLTSADWDTFSGKQAAGDYVTALTGDVSATGPGSAAATLATVNSNVGTFGDATNTAQVTVNAKGLVTAVSNVAISGVPAAAHDILSATHGDTLAGVVARGSLIVGNATPKWAALALGGVAGSVLTRNATDAAWSAFAFSGTAAMTYTLPAITDTLAGLGTANVFTTSQTITGNLTVQSNADTRILFKGSSDTPAIYPYLSVQRSRGTLTSPTTLSSGDVLGGFNFYGWNGTTYQLGGGITAVVDGAPGTYIPAYIQLGVVDSAGTAYYPMRAGKNYLKMFTTLGNATLQVQSGTSAADYEDVSIGGLGGWATNEEHSYNAVYSSGKVGSLMFRFNGTYASAYLGNFYNSGAKTNKLFSFLGTGLFGVGTETPAVAIHASINPATTNSVDEVLRLARNTTGTAAAGLGSSLDWYLESSTTADQLAARDALLWTDATHATRTALRYRETIGNATQIARHGEWEHNAVSNSAITIVPNGTRDCASVGTFRYAVKDNTSGATNGGMVVLNPGGAAVSLLSDGVDTLQIQAAADGSVSVVRSAGSHTFSIAISGSWF